LLLLMHFLKANSVLAGERSSTLVSVARSSIVDVFDS